MTRMTSPPRRFDREPMRAGVKSISVSLSLGRLARLAPILFVSLRSTWSRLGRQDSVHALDAYAPIRSTGCRVSGSLCGTIGENLALELRDGEDPFLAADRFEDGAFLKYQDQIAGRHENEIPEWTTHLWKQGLQCVDAATDPLDGHASVDQSFGRLQSDEIFEVVAMMTAGRSRRRNDQSRLGPILELPSRQIEQFDDLAGLEMLAPARPSASCGLDAGFQTLIRSQFRTPRTGRLMQSAPNSIHSRARPLAGTFVSK